MTYKTRVSYDGYEGLFIHESTAIVGYMDRNDSSELVRIIREPPESRLSIKSQGMRDFIADFVEGKISRSKGIKKDREDFELFLHIRDLVDDNVPLKSNSKGDSRTAFSITAEKFYPGQDKERAVEEAYKRIKKKYFKGM